MKLKIDVTPLYGAQSDDHATATLLSLDGLNILLDCGWNSAFDPAFLTNLASVAPSVDAVLLSHPDIPHLGALPYASSKLGLTAPVYSTLPVWRMGQMFMYDAFISQDSHAPFTLFDLDDVDATFDYHPEESKHPRFTLLKYQQGVTLQGLPNNNGDQVTITPHRAGHMIGGTIWHIAKATASIVYAVHINHRKDRHLSPTTLANFSRPSHLLLSATNALAQASAGGEDQLMKTVRRSIKKGGNVLIPADTAGRIIELAVLLETACEHDSTFREVRPQLIVLHTLATRTFDFARSMIEWSSDEFMAAFDVTRKNMFQLKNVRLVQDVSNLDAIQSPAVVLASSASLEIGPARTLFSKWAGDSRNTVILVDRKEKGTLAAQLFDFAEKKKNVSSKESEPKNDGKKMENGGMSKKTEEQEEEKPFELDLVMGKKVPLQGEELQQWREKERSRKRLEAEQKRKEEEEAQRQEEEQKRKEQLEEARLRGESEAVAQGQVNGDTDVNMPSSREGTVGMMASMGNGNTVIGTGSVVSNKPDQQMKEAEEDINNVAGEEYEQLLLSRLRELGVVQTKRSEMFEAEVTEKLDVDWDEYGQKLDTVRFIIGEDPGDGGIFDESTMRKDGGEVDSDGGIGVGGPSKKPDETQQDEQDEEQEVTPMKHVSQHIKVVVECDIVIADCSGISDGDSLRHLVKEVEPRHVTIVAGTKDETKVLGQNLKKALSATSVIATPHTKETVDMVTDVSVYNFSLDDTLVKTVQWENVGLARIGFVDGRMTNHVDSKGLGVLGMNNVDRSSRHDDDDAHDLDDGDEMDVGVYGSSSSEERGVEHGTFFVGTIMLNKLKDRMAEAGLKADFAGGALCVENPKNGAVVLVKKVGGQHISLQGSLCEEYFTVQDLLYKQVVIPR